MHDGNQSDQRGGEICGMIWYIKINTIYTLYTLYIFMNMYETVLLYVDVDLYTSKLCITVNHWEL